ncbi:hypothetical protein HMN09_00511500 [Mycena chlorophos]|uniref:Sodium/calcium exchanger membrane region domain-containing protein n=1 Tax=Mycena chlorophos TaxID=658473 RepID=A0A8H6WII9_MYCCL|nr:hypothetical protein HMN09_00511500 [Mycena chlorophos]
MSTSDGIAMRRFSRLPTDEEYEMETPTPESASLVSVSTEKSVKFSQRFLRTGKRRISVAASFKAIAFSSWLNVLIIFLPISWAAHFVNKSGDEKAFPYTVTFLLCFFAIIPLEKLFDYCGEQMAHYLGDDLGELLVVSLNNTVEATLAIILLRKCELRLLQSTIIGVVVLHLLLVPGVAFITGGARIVEQDLHPHLTSINQSLLIIGVLTLLLPVAFYAAMDNGAIPSTPADAASTLVNDTTRGMLLQISRGLAVLLLSVYICSRFFLHNPPGENEKEEEEPEINPFVCLGVIAVTVALMAGTAEWLVDSIEFVRDEQGISQEFFGLIILPLVSFSGDAVVSVLFFVRSLIQNARGVRVAPGELADARPIDLSIQFTMFWMPFLCLLGWVLGKPLILLFDLYEVAILIGACFIVNYVVADSKTNWLEGYAMFSFYIMIALCTWFYQGQKQIQLLLGEDCQSVVDTIAYVAAGGELVR